MSTQTIESRLKDIKDRRNEGTDLYKGSEIFSGYIRNHRRAFICISTFAFVMVFWILIVIDNPFSIPVFCELPYHKYPL